MIRNITIFYSLIVYLNLQIYQVKWSLHNTQGSSFWLFLKHHGSTRVSSDWNLFWWMTLKLLLGLVLDHLMLVLEGEGIRCLHWYLPCGMKSWTKGTNLCHLTSWHACLRCHGWGQICQKDLNLCMHSLPLW